MYQSCPCRQAERPQATEHSSNTWAHISAKNPLSRHDSDENRAKWDPSHISHDHEAVTQPPSADAPNTNIPSVNEETQNYRKGKRRHIPSNQGEEDRSYDTDTGSDHTPHYETDMEMETSAVTPNTNEVQLAFMSANEGEETQVETAVDHGRAVKRPTEEAESQDERMDTPEPDAKIKTLGKTQTRAKKMKLENGDEAPQEHKRNGTRASRIKKDKV
jgi:hypothetical protein